MYSSLFQGLRPSSKPVGISIFSRYSGSPLHTYEIMYTIVITICQINYYLLLY